MARPKQSSLLGVQWRFLSDDVANASLVPDSLEAPWTDEARRRITYLEKALASSHDLDSQYQSFLNEAGQHATNSHSSGGGGQWGSLRKASQVPNRTSELSDGVDLLTDGQTGSVDVIPSDPFDAQPTLTSRFQGRANPRGAPPSTRLEGGVGTAADAAGSTAAEDDEVARVQARAAAAASGEGEPAAEAPDRNSPSPVIIWRHAAPVRLANNVPADLLPPGAPKAAGGEPRRRRASPRRGAEAGFGASTDAAASPRAAERQRRINYGAWYLPVSTWASTTSSAMELLPKLYSSRIYKDYLKAQHIHRIPHYLANVESPKQLPARRGNIPLLDGAAASTGEASS